MKALAEERGKSGIASEETTLASIEKTAAKKKVKIVKKIVKKKVIKKVPKRVSDRPNCNDLEKIASPNPNDNAPMEIEKPNVVVEDFREVESMKEFEVSDGEKGVRLIENNDSCRDENKRNGLITTSLLNDQNRIELHDREHDDINNMCVEENEGESSKMDVGISEDTKVDESVKEHDVKIEGGLSSDVKEEEGMNENIDLKLSDVVEDHEIVKELLRAEEGLSERRVASEEMVARGWHMKPRTKIFIHGFDKDTKEEDIRKVFEEVGEVVEVKLITNLKTGKNRGFGFIRYASAGLAKLALTKYHNVEICGRLCHTAAIEGNDTILLSNIDKKWSSEHLRSLLQKIGIKKIDEVSVVADPKNTELNRGFAYLELETKRDAQMAYHRLQNKNVFGTNSKIQVTWAEPLADPVEEEMHNVKSVYAEHIPSSWDEEEVKDHFKIFGEIESIALAKNLRTAKRNDFAFINYKTCEAALSCIETLTCKQSTSNNVPKDQLKVSLAKSIPKGKPVKTISEPAVTEVSKVKQKANQGRSVYKPHNPKNMKVSSISKHEDSRKDRGSSTTAELVQLLREQASWKRGGPSSTTGMSSGHHQPPSGGKQPFTQLGSKSLSHHDPRAYHQTHLQIPIVAHPRPTANGVALTSFPHYDHQRAHYTSGSFNGVEANPRYFQTRDQATYPGSSSIYRQMH